MWLNWLARPFPTTKRFDESLAELRRTQELDPLSPQVNS
jgi:hypothetical protein